MYNCVAAVTQETELIEAMQAADLDGDGTINYEEFIVATVNLAKLEKVPLRAHAVTVNLP